ncbi:MAG: Re/Si-specific NAD(P)(+) transhydrogenase subunit beta [Succinivibrio sp.]|uniref:NAD(P) transhydrogenase subunit beta n=1 Tax=Succinivibrio faecicola TaxID=2820300 RepID=A0ABS7DFY9_9GAMM|nr:MULTISPECIES: Re/Si-specific NAD(P)(+) transhydrogenase subunit beta [Succinivibrio]MBW7570199.1 Re/Si-specific NAD(P)(+) transhydrogenase subunit beta [Succinivibrio faecicola]MCI6939717.1 Re/Si-specific NAD(P)(+) transhydrogenase subunit beta [Succinatimonas hippei]MDD6206008.1 Re/Si-specific NAD(P)(+) transhydrogenase subunit beta [Succinivibrio sp.]
MLVGLTHMAYILAALLFIMALAGLSKQETAKMGCLSGMVGMTVALVATFAQVESAYGFAAIVLAMVCGAAVGVYVARKVQMTQMPELIACLHSFVGLAAVLVGFNSYLQLIQATPIIDANSADLFGELVNKLAAAGGHKQPAMFTTELVEIFLGVFIGAVTFTGSIVAYGKLNGTYKLRIFKSAPLSLPHGNLLNLAALVVSFLLMIWFVASGDMAQSKADAFPLIAMTIIALLFGIHLVAAIGGADMPVVISMLNSYSGWAAAASGFMLSNDLLIVTGALVGSSGAILSYIMCKAMNRSFISVIAGGFGNAPAAKKQDEEMGEYRELKAPEVADLLKNSSSVIITPGYGMAVAQAQNAVASLTEKLKARGVEVRFAIHPVAGRLPGHMNVLLAEAKVPYDIVFEMDEINDDFENTDTVLVIGANDTVNPAASEDPSSPIAGMPVLEVWKARNVVVFKRSMNPGYAGVQNPLFFKENSSMCFGDAKKTVEDIVANI